MINNIIYNGQRVCGNKKEKKHNWFILENGDKIGSMSLNGKEVLIQCHECQVWKKVKFYQGSNGLLKRIYLCQKCGKIGERNGFYGHKHTKELKKKLSTDRKGKYAGEKNPMYERNVWAEMSAGQVKEAKRKLSESCGGEKNGFYGKKHTEKTKKIIKEKTKKWRDSLTDEDKKNISKITSLQQKKIFADNPDQYRRNRRKAAFASAKSIKKYKINKIEAMVRDELLKRKLDFKYCVILGYYQFDFGNKKHRILIEVQGDYWHSNPEIYGEGKRKLNKIQMKKMGKDKKKKIFAQKHGMKLFCIWEKDIMNGNFEVIDDIERVIRDAEKI